MARIRKKQRTTGNVKMIARFHQGRINVERVGLNVDKDGRSAGKQNAVDRGNKGKGRGNGFSAQVSDGRLYGQEVGSQVAPQGWQGEDDVSMYKGDGV